MEQLAAMRGQAVVKTIVVYRFHQGVRDIIVTPKYGSRAALQPQQTAEDEYQAGRSKQLSGCSKIPWSGTRSAECPASVRLQDRSKLLSDAHYML